MVANAMWVPSGDQAGPKSPEGSSVRRTRSVPSAAIEQMSTFPATTSHWKASRAPSGDQVGRPADPTSCVSCVTPDPSAFMTKIWVLPARLLSNAIFDPSGDHAGAVSAAGSWVRFVRVPSERSSTTMSSRIGPPLKAIFDPSGDHVGSMPSATDDGFDPSGFAMTM
jgi:hypothetical protein